MVTNNVTVYQFEVGLDEVFADKVRFRVNVDCVIVVVTVVISCIKNGHVCWILVNGAHQS